MVSTTIKTPCIGICTTGIGDFVCRGCKRFVHEVIDWNTYSQEQQQLVVSRLAHFLEQIVNSKIEIFNERLLLECMQKQSIPFDLDDPSSRWVYELLRNGASQITHTEDFGFRLRSDWKNFSLEEIKQFLEQDFYALSSAHYERYFSVR